MLILMHWEEEWAFTEREARLVDGGEVESAVVARFKHVLGKCEKEAVRKRWEGSARRAREREREVWGVVPGNIVVANVVGKEDSRQFHGRRVAVSRMRLGSFSLEVFGELEFFFSFRLVMCTS